MKKTLEHFILVACLIPLFFINIKSSHDWGDDFAQYIHQAKNIVSGTSQNETGYIFNENCFTGPIAYPVGFPLLLSPVIKHYGVDFYYLNLYQSLFLVLTCLMGFIILRQYLSFFTAFFTALIIAYNPVFLNFKTEIISDLPFAFFSMLCVYLIQKKNNYLQSIVLGLLIGFTIHIRSVGALLVIALLFNNLFLQKSIKSFHIKNQIQTLLSLASTLVIYLLIKFSYPANTNYPSIFETENFWQTINDHFSYNIHHLSWIFRGYETKNYFSIGVIASSCLIAFSFLGLLHFYRANKKSIYTYYVFSYLLLVISYKYSHAGMRFLYPILFFIFLFAIIGLKKSIEPFIVNQKWLAIVFGTLILFSFQDEIEKIKLKSSEISDGPQLTEAQELFTYMNTHIKKNAVIAFDKPRALALYTHAQSFAFYPAISNEEIIRDIKKFKAQYYLTNETQSTDVIKNFPLTDSLHFHQVLKNKLFKLYEINY